MVTRSLRALAVTAGLLSAPLAPAFAVAQSAGTDAGPYLAARVAAAAQDYEAAADWFQTALGADPRNPALLEGAIGGLLASGEAEAAVPLAERLRETGAPSPVANMVLQIDAAKRGDWNAIFDLMEADRGIGPLADGLTRAWARLGQGRMDQALSAFDEVIETRGLRGFGLYHKAMALSVAGDLSAAEAILASAPGNGLPLSRQVVTAHARILGRLDRHEEALALLDRVGRGDAVLEALRQRIAQEPDAAYDEVTSAVEGLSDLYVSVAGALGSEAPGAFALLYSRAALALDPDRVEALLVTATLLERAGRLDLAQEAYAEVPEDHPAHVTAELGRAAVLRRAGETARALEVLEQLSRTAPDLAEVHVAIGDLQRAREDAAAAEAAYSAALELAGEEAAWWLYYMRGIARHERNDWPGAEADFRAALEIDPDRAEVLNFLGYSLVERGEALDEALDMIERAVRSQPDNGAIVDSLGWAQFKLGRYEEAVGHLERAAELEPVDPIVNDHLGDGYWAVGRQTEARFQWQRALSFDPTPEEALRIRKKLEQGLDAVISAEGGVPLRQVARGE
ncbi:tetratricopeptide repeat protein [Limimaricola litoreus]|uniref:Tetratricopeptide repeat protein n=1 Tax=Limimaricola litoreus TaxID=2955316 RepID=A0A9X2FR70_9RHOB|nr:tetratricopeptide repeat protein [Limimaricola litoreus]MCP1170362.1 tetratricopeptide repeat protein [Limimaricola litoreus]